MLGRSSRSRFLAIALLIAGGSVAPFAWAASTDNIAAARTADNPARVWLIRGTVTLEQGLLPSDPLVIYIQDATGGIAVRTAKANPGLYNAIVEAEGPVTFYDGQEPELQATRFTVMGVGPRVAPELITEQQAERGPYGGKLVRVRGTVVKSSAGSTRDIVYFHEDPDAFHAYVRHRDGGTTMVPGRARPGAVVEVIGIPVPMHRGLNQLRMRYPEDLLLIREPPWTGEKYVQLIVALLAGAGIIVFLWIATLRRSLHRKTAELRADIAERKRAEDSLRQAEHRIRLLTENLTEMVLAYDMDRQLTYANPAVEKLTGYSLAELQKERFICWVHPDDQPRMLGHWNGLFEGKRFEDEEYRLVTKLGELKWVSASWGPIRDESGLQIGVQGSERDISAKKKAEEEKAKLEEQFLQSQKLESVGRLAGGVAHDFNNLLTVINGYSDVVIGEMEADNPLRASVEEVRKAGERAAGLTQQLLGFSRRQITHPRPLDLNAVVSDAEKILRRIIGEDIELVVALDPSPAAVTVDPGQLHQVLMNLAVNARDAMPNGGTLRIATEAAPPDAGAAAAGSGEPGPHVLLSVSDTGIGMTEEIRRHVFEPFFTTKEAGKGTGLGLATVYGIVRQNHGWVAVDSELGKGSRFRIYLPRTCERVGGTEPVADATRAPRGSETVLLAEDQEAVRAFAANVLRKHGYRVLEAANGGEALSLVARATEPIDLVLTDVVMPGMNGRELVEKLSVLVPNARTLYMSGYTPELTAQRGVLGSDACYLAKPFAPNALLTKVRAVLDQSRG